MTTLAGASIDHPIGLNGTVHIKVPSGGLTIQGIDGDAVHVSSPSGRDLADQYRIETADGSIDIGVRTGQAGIVGWLTGPRFDPIHVEVPRDALVRIETASGTVHVDGLRGEQHYNAASGSIKLTDAAGPISIDHISGDVKVRATGPVDLIARTVSGDINASAPLFGTLQFRTMSGSVRIAGRLADDGDFALESVSGDLSIELDGPARIEGSSLTGRIRTDLAHRESGKPGRRMIEIGDNGPRVFFKTVSGDLRVTGPKAAQASGDGVAADEVPAPDADPVFAATTPAMPIPPIPPIAPIAPEAPIPPIPPIAPIPPLAPEAPIAAFAPVGAPAADTVGGPAVQALASTPEAFAARRLSILQELETGRIEVGEASRLLADVDAEEDRARTRARSFDIGPLHGELRWDHRA